VIFVRVTFFQVIALGLGTLLAGRCINFAGGAWAGHELSRITSPDGKLDAVLIEGSGGATTSVSLRVFVVMKDTEFTQQGVTFQREQASFTADSVKDLNLRWTRPSLLHIEYSKARIFSLSNFGSVKDVNSLQFNYEIRLEPLDFDSSLIPPNSANQSQKNQ
jgi:hypothetical protein